MADFDLKIDPKSLKISADPRFAMPNNGFWALGRGNFKKNGVFLR
jgi:hypothetical protein